MKEDDEHGCGGVHREDDGFIDYYRILRVDSKDCLATIRKAFIQRARETHPDKNVQYDEDGNESTSRNDYNESNVSSEFVLVRKAFEILRDECARKKYDVMWSMYYYNGSNSVSRTAFAVDCSIDLDDMQCAFDDKNKLYVFSKSCRCGEKLEVNEDQLEQNLKSVDVATSVENVAIQYRLQCPTCSFVTLVLYCNEQSHEE